MHVRNISRGLAALVVIVYWVHWPNIWHCRPEFHIFEAVASFTGIKLLGVIAARARSATEGIVIYTESRRARLRSDIQAALLKFHWICLIFKRTNKRVAPPLNGKQCSISQNQQNPAGVEMSPPPTGLEAEYKTLFTSEALLFLQELISSFDEAVDEVSNVHLFGSLVIDSHCQNMVRWPVRLFHPVI